MNLPAQLRSIIALLVFLPVLSFCQFQVALTDGTSGTCHSSQSIFTSDMGRVVTCTIGGTMHIRKYNEVGELIWSKDFTLQSAGQQLEQNATILPDDNGGFRMVLHSRTTESISSSEPWPTVLQFIYVHMDQNGSLIGSSSMERTVLNYVTQFISGIGIQLLDNGSGGIRMLVERRYSASPELEIVDLGPDGTPFRAIAYTGAIPYFDSTVPVQISKGQNGEYYLSHSTFPPLGPLTLFRISDNGDVIWGRQFDYTNNVVYVRYDDIAIAPDGSVNAIGSLSIPSGEYKIMPVIAGNGDLVRVDLYADPTGSSSQQIVLAPNGDRIVVSTSYSPWSSSGSCDILKADNSGSPAELHIRKVTRSGQDDYYGLWSAASIKDDRLLIPGTLVEEDFVLSYQIKREMMLDLDVNDLSSCFLKDTVVAHVEVPLSIMSTTTIPVAPTTDVLQDWSWTSIDTLFVEDAVDPALSELCEFAIGINENQLDRDHPLIMNNMVLSGTVLKVIDPEVRNVAVFDRNGSLLHQVKTIGTGPSIPTIGWSSGMYLLQGTDRNGAHIGTQRIVVE